MTETDVAGLPIDVIKELMRQKGFIAHGGNYRMLPFDESVTNSAADSTTSPAVSGAPTVDPNGNVVDASGNVVAKIEPDGSVTAVDPSLSTDGGININWDAILAGAGGAALANAIAHALRKRGHGDKVPLVEGEVLRDPLAPLPPGVATVEGEFTNVDDPSRLGAAAASTENGSAVAHELSQNRQRQLSSNSTGKSIEDIPRPRYLTRREMAERRLRPEARSSQGTDVIEVEDAVGDLTAEEKAKVNELADALVERRKAGNQRKAKGGKGVGRQHLPTGPTDKESLVNTIVRILRDTGALKAARAIP